ncbi:hypothetical protein ACHAQJ_000638 [Trichoderma viride]
MTGALSKRQQARNEAILQELVHSVPGNDLCADCHARNPAWASWSVRYPFLYPFVKGPLLAIHALGVFLCMRCATIHRKLGTHISKVKSLSMDSWTNEQVDNMRKVGNLTSNKVYNPENKKPSIPIDVDEADSAMERFIRQKYINSVGGQAGKLKKPQLDEGTPPPLPPKNSKFGFRSASSIFPLSSRAKKEAKAAAAQELANSNPSSNHANKQSKVFGAAVDYGQDDADKKLARLRDMGFQDDQRNAAILRGVNGNLERAVEALVRLGEGDRPSPGPVPTAAERTLRVSRSLTPVGSNSAGLSLGLSVPQKEATPERPTTATATSTNPFDIFPPAQPQTAHSTGTLQTNNPFMNSTNPYGTPAQQANHVSQAFQNMSLSPVAQSLFPHHTGGVISTQPHQSSMYHPQQAAAQSIPQQYQNLGFQSSMTYPQPAAQPLAPQHTSYNPFFTQAPTQFQQQQFQQQQQQQQQVPQQAPQQSLSLNTNQPAAYANNPFTRSPTRISSPSLTQIPEQSLPTMFQSPTPLQPHLTGTNPFLNNGIQYHQQVQQQHQQQPQFQHHQQQQPQYFGQQQQQYYQPQRQDKASILALYGQQQAARPTASEPNIHAQTPTIPEDRVMPMHAMQPVAAPAQSPLAATQPVVGNNNPFMKSGPVAVSPDPFATDRKISRESMNLGMDMAWTNGRHSPDAFASLSARHG